MDVLQELLGADRMMEDQIEHALLELAVERVGAEIWEWGEVGLVLGIDLQPDEGSWNQTGTNSLASCGARSPLETGEKLALPSGAFDRSTRGATRANSSTTPISKWGKEGEAWHWKQNSV